MNSSTSPTIIIGAGFAGLFTALHLRHQHDLRSIILIDPQARFVFKPMLYELLTGELPEDTVCPTYEELLQGSDITFVQDKVVAIDLKEKRLDVASGSDYTYNNLVLAVGSIQGYLGTEALRNMPLHSERERTPLHWNTSCGIVCNELVKRMIKQNDDRC